MTSMPPCNDCLLGNHDECVSVLCNCLVDHPNDDDLMRGFKRLKRMSKAEREAEIRQRVERSMPPPTVVRVTAEVGKRIEPRRRFVAGKEGTEVQRGSGS